MGKAAWQSKAAAPGVLRAERAGRPDSARRKQAGAGRDRQPGLRLDVVLGVLLGGSALLLAARCLPRLLPARKRAAGHMARGTAHHPPAAAASLPFPSRRDGHAVGRRATDRPSSYEQLRDLSAALQAIREEERTHIARELHDDLGQLLATLRVDLSLLQQQPHATPVASRQVRSMDKLLLQAITSLRRIATDLRPSALDEGGLFYALRTLHEEWTQRHGVDCQLSAQEEELALDDRYSTAVFRIVQESLNNIARHAQARHVLISVRKQGGQLRLLIEDDGRGIASADLDKTHSFGLLGMRERVWALNGNITIGNAADSGSAHGTRISVELPLANGTPDRPSGAQGTWP